MKPLSTTIGYLNYSTISEKKNLITFVTNYLQLTVTAQFFSEKWRLGCRKGLGVRRQLPGDTLGHIASLKWLFEDLADTRCAGLL